MFKENINFEEYNFNKDLSFTDNFKNYADYCTKERIMYYFDNQDKCNINDDLKRFIKEKLHNLKEKKYKDTEMYIIEREFYKIINQSIYGRLFKTIIGNNFIYDYKIDLKRILDKLCINLNNFYNHYNIYNFCTETGTNIVLMFAFVMLDNDNYSYMILNTLRHNLDILNKKAVI